VKFSPFLAFFVPLFCGALALAALGPSERAILTAEARRAADPALVTMLDGQPDVAARAALALGRSKRGDARKSLRAHLGNAHDSALRAMIAYSLGLLEDSDALAEERRMVRDDESSAVRYAAADAIGRIALAQAHPPGDAADTLMAVMRADKDPIVRGHAAAALDAFRTSNQAASISTALAAAIENERNPGVRWHLMWTIFRGYATGVEREPLARAIADRDELVRIEAVRAWAKRTDSDAAPLVTLLLGDPSWRVQLQARETLRALAKQPPTDHLTSLPPDLHLPPPDRPNRESVFPGWEDESGAASGPPRSGIPRPKPSAPTLEDVVPSVPFAPESAAELNGGLPGKHPRVRIRTTKGDIVLRLYPEWAPMTVANFLKLAHSGYFNGNRWFRIVPDFVVQTGDPNDNGEGDAGYSIPAEENPIEQRTGVISMGLNYKDGRAIRDSAGTQFYITISPQLHLDRDFTVFGEVESGLNTIARLIESDRMVRVERLADL
jgi:peptidyl-prolyl cis-trans isomerase B (cyclophilin B)